MRFFSLDDLRCVIEDELPRQAIAILDKANSWQGVYAERKQHNRRLVSGDISADLIVRAMTETEYLCDPDLLAKKDWLPRFMLRH